MPTARLRTAATDDVARTIDHLVEAAGHDLATRFVEQLEHTVRTIEQHPQIGSLRYGYELDLPDLRSIRIDSFPYLVFYLDRGAVLDVLRVLHTSRDIPAALQE